MSELLPRLLEILQTTSSPVERVDHTTGDSFVNNINKDDTEEVVREKVAVWYRNMVRAGLV